MLAGSWSASEQDPYFSGDRIEALVDAVSGTRSRKNNVAWSAVFFRLRYPGPAFAEIVMLWVAILATSIEFWRAVPAAGWLLLPYLFWVSYATALNFSIWRLNT